MSTEQGRLFGLRRAIGFLGVAVLVGSALALVLRFVTVSRPLLALLVSVAPVGVVLGAAAILVGVVPARTWLRLGLVVAVIAAVVGTVGANPVRLLCLTSGSGGDQDAGDTGAALTVYSHNVLWRSGDPAVVAAQILDADADLVMLQESDAAFVAALRTQLGDRYPHVVEAASTKTLSLATFSRRPLTDVIDTSAGWAEQNPTLVTTVDVDGKPMRLANIHLSAPRNEALSPRWLAELDTLTDDPFDADVLVGDFNASSAHKPFRQLLGAGYRDAHAEAGCGTGTTWTIFGAGPSLLHLDHVLLTDQVGADSYRTEGRAGSDHRAMVTTLSWSSAGSG